MIEQQEDHTWAIVNRSEGYQYDRDAALINCENVVGLGEDGVVKSCLSTSSDYGIIKQILDTDFVRTAVPDILSIGLGFSASAGPNTTTCVDLTWVLRGPQASLFPMVTTTIGFGAGNPGADGTINIGKSWMLGNPNNLKRKMVETQAFSNLGFNDNVVSAFGSVSEGVGPSIGITLNYSNDLMGNKFFGIQANIGIGAQPGLGLIGGSYNTIINYDFAK